MATEPSILKHVKKLQGLDEGYTDFDLDVITYINAAFFSLNRIGIGPVDGFVVEDESDEWDDFVDVELNKSVMNALQSYVALKVRLAFDPPGTPHHIAALKEQISELEHTLKTERSLAKWSPSPLP